jgi:sulfatase maturation enzyme AslB (radical SAM superfamily)
MSDWKCAAIDHGVTIFPNGKIGPCCKIHASYLKPIETILDSDRFADLNTEYPPAACERCISDEDQGIVSYRSTFNKLKTSAPGLQFVDIRNNNLCNLKCRYCGPHFSSSWAKELGQEETSHQDIEPYKDIIISDDLHWMYFTGGEPLINPEHWDLLEELISRGLAQNISLLYNTNLTTVKYRDIDIVDIWSHFKSVNIQCSIDAIGKPFEFIRSGAKWDKVDQNLQKLIAFSKHSDIKISLSPVISILNIWFLDKLFEYNKQYNLHISPIVLTGPDYLALDVVPDELKELALEHLEKIKSYIPKSMYNQINNLINNNINSCLFNHTLSHVLLLDNIRGEKLFDLLPFDDVARDQILRNYEYQ